MPKKVSEKEKSALTLDVLIQQTLEDLYRRRAELRTAISTLESKLDEQVEERETVVGKADAQSS